MGTRSQRDVPQGSALHVVAHRCAGRGQWGVESALKRLFSKRFGR